jgi:arginyl-tRNA---protein transferase
MKYYLNSQLIAVGVVDIMPEGLSLVHFFYDPSFKKLSMGFIGNIK